MVNTVLEMNKEVTWRFITPRLYLPLNLFFFHEKRMASSQLALSVFFLQMTREKNEWGGKKNHFENRVSADKGRVGFGSRPAIYAYGFEFLLTRDALLIRTRDSIRVGLNQPIKRRKIGGKQFSSTAFICFHWSLINNSFMTVKVRPLFL